MTCHLKTLLELQIRGLGGLGEEGAGLAWADGDCGTGGELGDWKGVGGWRLGDTAAPGDGVRWVYYPHRLAKILTISIIWHFYVVLTLSFPFEKIIF